MNPDDLGELFREACPAGRQLVWLVVVNGRPQQLSIRASKSSGPSIISQMVRSLRAVPDLRDALGAVEATRKVKVLFIFACSIQAGTLQANRRLLHSHLTRQAEYMFGRNGYTLLQKAKTLKDQSIQFQIDFDIDNLDVLDFQSSSTLNRSLNPSQLKAEFERITLVNLIRTRLGARTW